MSEACEFVVICFDIADDRRRRHAVRVLEAFGWRAQESTFESWLNVADLRRLKHQLDAVIDATEDRVAIYVLSPTDKADVVSLGRGLPTEDFRNAVL